jgi:hypothetical protein
MSRSRQRAKGRTDTDKSFAGIPRRVMDNPDYKNLSGNAVKLLLELARQYKGDRIANNGDLTAAWGVLKERGFNSKKTISRAVQELLNARMIVQTRSGRFINPGGRCSLYALSWLPINECPGKDLEVQSTITPPRKFSLENSEIPGPQNGPDSVHKRGRQRVRNEDGTFSSVHKRGRWLDVA